MSAASASVASDTEEQLGGESMTVAPPPLTRRGDGLAAWNQARKRTILEEADQLGMQGHVRKEFRDLSRSKRKTARLQQRSLEQVQHDLDAVEAAWNKGKLAVGSHVDAKFRLRTFRHGGIPLHPKTWTSEGTLKLAFSRIGSLCPDPVSIRGSKRSIDAIAAVALAAEDYQRQAVQTWSSWLGTCTAEAPGWVVHARQHDSTPVRVQFGALSDLAMVSRFWYQESSECMAKLVHASDLVQRGMRLPAYGIVEMMAQAGTLSWPQAQPGGGFLATCTRKLLFPPRFLERSNGSTIFETTDQVEPSLSVDRLLALTASVPFVVLCVGSDMASACVRAKLEIGHRTREHDLMSLQVGQGVALLLDVQCVAHMLQRELENVFQMKELVPKLYSTAWCSSLPGVMATMSSVLRAIVQADLAVGFYPRAPPPPEAVRRTAALARSTVMKCKRMRAGHDEHREAAEGLLQHYLQLLNGDPRKPFIEHYCHAEGCCNGHSRAVAVDRICGLLDKIISATWPKTCPRPANGGPSPRSLRSKLRASCATGFCPGWWTAPLLSTHARQTRQLSITRLTTGN